VHVVPFGADIEETPTLDFVRRIVAARSTKVCKLLFFGATWFRKDGDIAVEVARELNAAGLPTDLLVMGVRPPLLGPTPSFVRYCGKINKSSHTRPARFKALMATWYFLILPSRADCTPVVFSEANAFGVRCLATRVGGIQSIIRDGVNGSTFEPTAAVSSYCNYISTHFTNQERYHDLGLSAFCEHVTRLNWSVAGRAVSELLANVKS
jgi:glycosyltransferase involved in cell wall biosynthesis